MGLRAFAPWWVRMGGKLVLSRLPVPYSFWSRINLFRHGRMDNSAYALECFETHWQAAADRQPATILEIGPGDSIASALIARARGVVQTWLVDSAQYAKREVAAYAGLWQRLPGAGPMPTTFDALCTAIGCNYLTAGVRSLAQIPDASVDLVFSHATLEHVPVDELGALYRETRRVLRPDGVASHQVDLQDHLGGGLANLRFGRAFWEGDWVRNGGFYTNRVRLSEHLRLIETAGFRVRDLAVRRFTRPMISRSALAPEFRRLSDDDLTVSGFRAVLDPSG